MLLLGSTKFEFRISLKIYLFIFLHWDQKQTLLKLKGIGKTMYGIWLLLSYSELEVSRGEEISLIS